MHRYQPRFHHGRATDDYEQSSARPEHSNEVLVEHGHGARNRDRVEPPRGHVHRQGVRGFDLDVVELELGESRTGGGHQLWHDVDACHLFRKPGDAGGEVAGTRPDFENLVDPLDLERLEDPAFYLRCEHALTVADGNLGIGECEVAIVGGHEPLARSFGNGSQHPVVQDLPCSDLLPEHLGPCGFEIHRCCADGGAVRNALGYGV